MGQQGSVTLRYYGICERDGDFEDVSYKNIEELLNDNRKQLDDNEILVWCCLSNGAQLLMSQNLKEPWITEIGAVFGANLEEYGLPEGNPNIYEMVNLEEERIGSVALDIVANKEATLSWLDGCNVFNNLKVFDFDQDDIECVQFIESLV